MCPEEAGNSGFEPARAVLGGGGGVAGVVVSTPIEKWKAESRPVGTEVVSGSERPGSWGEAGLSVEVGEVSEVGWAGEGGMAEGREGSRGGK